MHFHVSWGRFDWNPKSLLDRVQLLHIHIRPNFCRPIESFSFVVRNECRMLFDFVQLKSEHTVAEAPEVKAEYLSCLRSLYHLISSGATSKVGEGEEKELESEIQRIESEVSNGKNWSSSIDFSSIYLVLVYTKKKLFWIRLFSRAIYE